MTTTNKPLHPSTLRAVKRFAEECDLELARADRDCVIVGDMVVTHGRYGWQVKNGLSFISPVKALNDAWARKGKFFRVSV